MWKCPKCESDKLEVTVEVSARLFQDAFDGNFQTDTDEALDRQHNWDQNSPMFCLVCCHSAIADDFEVTE